jgi:hypothetical protein
MELSSSDFIVPQIVLATNSVPNFDLERSCRTAAAVAGLPGRDSGACQRDEHGARSTLQNDWTQYSSAQRIWSRPVAPQVTWNC